MWLRVDDGFIDHPKTIRAAAQLGRFGFGRVSGIWLEGMTYANRKLTDGFLATEVIRTFRADPKPLVVADVLGAVGLWDVCPGGFRIHHYHHFNPSAEAVKQKRADDRVRKENARRPVDVQIVSARTSTRSRARNPNPNPNPLPKDPRTNARPEENNNLEQRAGAFCERYRFELYPSYRHAAYVSNERNDFQAAVALCAVYEDEKLTDMAKIWLSIDEKDEPFVQGKTRTITMFKAKASIIDERLTRHRSRQS